MRASKDIDYTPVTCRICKHICCGCDNCTAPFTCTIHVFHVYQAGPVRTKGSSYAGDSDDRSARVKGEIGL